VTLSGAASATATADSSGNYSFTGLANGSYTVTPSKAGYTFSPTSANATVNNANVTVPAFIATAVIGGADCGSCVYVQSTESGGTGASDPTSYTQPTTSGDTLVVFGVHSNWSGSGTTTVTDSAGNTWHPCSGTGTGAFTDLQDGATWAVSCHYALNIIGAAVDTVKISASDCAGAGGCTWVAGTYLEYSGPTAWDNWGFNANATDGAGSNNVTCGSVTTTVNNDLIVCSIDQASGNMTAGTSPITFTMRETVSTAAEDGKWTSSGAINPTQTDSISGDTYAGITVAFK
jgi:hypothetical protein